MPGAPLPPPKKTGEQAGVTLTTVSSANQWLYLSATEEHSKKMKQRAFHKQKPLHRYSTWKYTQIPTHTLLHCGQNNGRFSLPVALPLQEGERRGKSTLLCCSADHESSTLSSLSQLSTLLPCDPIHTLDTNPNNRPLTSTIITPHCLAYTAPRNDCKKCDRSKQLHDPPPLPWQCWILQLQTAWERRLWNYLRN